MPSCNLCHFTKKVPLAFHKPLSRADGCTAAITNDDRLYTWGDGASANLGYANTLRQFIPRQVEKGLGDLKITQVCAVCSHSVQGLDTATCSVWTCGD